MRDPVNAAENYDNRHGCEGEAYPFLVNGECVSESIAESIALNQLVGDSESQDQEDGEEQAHPFAVKPVLHVVGRAAVERILAATFVELGQCRLDECRGGSEQCHYPHPEHCPWAAHAYCRGHSGQVSCADPAGERNRECLERTDFPVPDFICVAVHRTFLTDRPVHYHPPHILQQPELHSADADSEINCAENEKNNDHIGPQPVIDAVDDSEKLTHKL